MPSYGVTLLSGGLDSTTVAAYAKERVDHMSAITFHYGQSHAREVDCAARIAGVMGIEHQFLDISFLSDVAWYSALTNPDQFPAPSGRSDEEIGHGVPITYVPLRNTIFLSLAAAYLESRVLHAIEVEGVNASDVAASVYMAPERSGLQRIPRLPPRVLRGCEADAGGWQQALDRVWGADWDRDADHRPHEGADRRARNEARGAA